jgi:hypothetical protein
MLLALMVMVSLPAPALRTSIPPLPISVSSPTPATNISLSLVPTAIDLSAIASGTGGFVINGENVSSFSGISVSTAGDVNGDGLDDLIVSAIGGENLVQQNAGKSYVVFGKTDTNAIDLTKL